MHKWIASAAAQQRLKPGPAIVRPDQASRCAGPLRCHARITHDYYPQLCALCGLRAGEGSGADP